MSWFYNQNKSFVILISVIGLTNRACKSRILSKVCYATDRRILNLSVSNRFRFHFTFTKLLNFLKALILSRIHRAGIIFKEDF